MRCFNVQIKVMNGVAVVGCLIGMVRGQHDFEFRNAPAGLEMVASAHDEPYSTDQLYVASR